LDEWKTTIELKWIYVCEEGAESFDLAFVTESTLAQLQDDGSIDFNSEISAFSQEHEGLSIPGLQAWYDVNIVCICIPDKSTTRIVAPSTCEPSVLLLEEDFEAEENGQSWHWGTEYGWGNGITSMSNKLSHFLGRFGQGNDAATQAFSIPSAGGVVADKVVMEFDLYQIDHWDNAGDSFSIKIGDTDLGDLIAAEAGTVNEISWARTTTSSGVVLGFLSDQPDTTYHVTVDVPLSKLPGGLLEVSVSTSTSRNIDEQSVGIDNFKLSGAYGCDAGGRRLEMPSSAGKDEHDPSAHHFGMENFNSGNTYGNALGKANDDGKAGLDSSDEDEDDGPHCLAKDFPCDGGNKVYICHYSVFKGYNTYCVEEDDSDVIKFYPNDYCGSCVGGYGGKRSDM